MVPLAWRVWTGLMVPRDSQVLLGLPVQPGQLEEPERPEPKDRPGQQAQLEEQEQLDSRDRRV